MNKFSFLKNPWITLPILFTVFAIFLHYADAPKADAQREYSEEVKQIVAQIETQQNTFNAAESAEKAAQDALNKAATDKFNAQTIARGERFKLCTLHNLKIDDKGELADATSDECQSFQ